MDSIEINGKTYAPETSDWLCSGCAFEDATSASDCLQARKHLDCDFTAPDDPFVFKPIVWKEVKWPLPLPKNDRTSGGLLQSLSATGDNQTEPVALPEIHSNRVVTEEIRVTNAKGGVKADGGKIQPTMLLQDLPLAIKEVIKVINYGAKKYGRTNWALVEPERYDDANLRHVLQYLAGETSDTETSVHHYAHAIACLLFRLEQDLRNTKS